MTIHPEIGLPEYDIREVVARSEMRVQSSPSFVRQIHIPNFLGSKIATLGLARTLTEVVDVGFSEFADTCGGAVVPHQWGISRVRSRGDISHGDANFVVVAEVDRIIPTRPKDPEAIAARWDRGYEVYPKNHNGPIFTDRHKRDEFVFGQLATTGETNQWMVDLDALVRPGRNQNNPI